jgi:hypothetical protein
LTVHLIKLCVGAESVEDVIDWRSRTLQERCKAGLSAHMTHVTRMWPRREAELMDGGSIYWVVKGLIRLRQPLAGFEEHFNDEGIRYCRLLMEPTLMLTRPTPKRPFQGWRYLPADDAPPDLPGGLDALKDSDKAPQALIGELAELGLL